MRRSISSRVIRKIQYTIRPISNFFLFNYFKKFKVRAFQFNGKSYPYFYSMHNETFRNERSVEIPIVMHYIEQNEGKKILEVGNVLNYYFHFDHKIIDKYEKGDSILNYDISKYIPDDKFDLIVTISTLEHVGWDEYSRYGNESTNKINDPALLLKAIDNMKTMLNTNGVIVATMPLGFNSFLDSLIKEEDLAFTEIHFLKRISKDNQWQEVKYSEIENIRYSDPYPCANGLIIGLYQHS